MYIDMCNVVWYHENMLNGSVYNVYNIIYVILAYPMHSHVKCYDVCYC